MPLTDFVYNTFVYSGEIRETSESALTLTLRRLCRDWVA